MNIQKAMVKARKKNRAIRSKTWPKGAHIYHGMDNVMFDQDGREIIWSVALLMKTDYMTTKVARYHGPLGVNVPNGEKQDVIS